MSMPLNNSLNNPNDNMTNWTSQYPSLLPKNFLGISRYWDAENPPFTFMVMPVRNVKFNFQWHVRINPSAMAQEVEEGAETPIMDSEEKIESFVCREFRLGTKISQRLIDFGIKDVVRSKTQYLVEAVEKAREYLNILALEGVNVNQPLALERLNEFNSGASKGGTAKAWNEDGAKILQDILAMKKLIKRKSGQRPKYLFVPTEEYEALQQDDEILEQLKYTEKSLLINGEVPVIKGLQVVEIANFFKQRNNAKGVDERIYLLEDKVIMTTDNVGFTGIAEPMQGSAPFVERWYERGQRAIFMHAVSSFTPVIEDYARIGVIKGTDKLVS